MTEDTGPKSFAWRGLTFEVSYSPHMYRATGGWAVTRWGAGDPCWTGWVTVLGEDSEDRDNEQIHAETDVPDDPIAALEAARDALIAKLQGRVSDLLEMPTKPP